MGSSFASAFPVTPRMILQARKRLVGIIERTPVLRSKALGKIAEARVYIKWESLQRTGVFKLRGAYNKIASLPSIKAKQGVITASTGNHALAVAYAAQQLNVPATVIVPHGASPLKMAKCKEYGATILEHGSNYDEAAAYSVDYAESKQLTLVHAYADPLVIAGQGTVGYELLEDLPEVSLVVVPIGGGGLISGISLWVKTVDPTIRVIGVQTTATHAFYENFRKQQLFHVPVEPTIADGLAGNTAQLNLNIGLQHVDDVVLVEEQGLRQAIRWTLHHEHQPLEPAGVVGIAALLEKRIPIHKDDLVAIIASGSNLNPSLLAEIKAQ
ncbi:MAG: threonine/serine dehydratase [Promethearchaeota archaeon]